MRLAFLGTSAFAAAVLRRLAESPYRPALVITPPDRPRGRGRKHLPPPAAELAAELGLALHQTPNVNAGESPAAIAQAGIDTGLVCAFGQLIKAPLLDRVEMLNVHPSLLPRWRGAAPIGRAIMAGDEETGVAIMRLDEGLDSGPVALCERVAIARDDNFGSLSDRLAALGGELALRALHLHEGGQLEFAEQPGAGVTYAEKIEAAERRLDPRRSAVELERTVRALNPHVGTYLELEGDQRLGVVDARAGDGGPVQGQLEPKADVVLLGTGDGTLRISTVKPSGKRAMTAADYLRGNPFLRLAS